MFDSNKHFCDCRKLNELKRKDPLFLQIKLPRKVNSSKSEFFPFGNTKPYELVRFIMAKTPTHSPHPLSPVYNQRICTSLN